MTARTAARLFSRDTGLTFTQWRQQLRSLKALQALSLGESVTQVALAVGYQMCRRLFRCLKTPLHPAYARDRRAPEFQLAWFAVSGRAMLLYCAAVDGAGGKAA